VQSTVEDGVHVAANEERVSVWGGLYRFLEVIKRHVTA
jgi:hypothetical protein